METRETLVALAEEIGSVFEPLQDALASPKAFSAFMYDLGWDMTQPPQPVQDLSASVTAVLNTIEAGGITGANVAGLMTQITSLITGIKGLSSISSALLPASVDATEFKNEFPGQLMQFLVVEYLLGNQANWGRLMQTIGIIRISYQAAAGKRTGYFKREIAWQDLGNFFNDPTAVFTNAYNWGTSNFKADYFYDTLYNMGSAFGLAVRQEPLHPNVHTILNQGASDPTKIFPLQLKFILLEDNSSSLQYAIGVALYLLPETAGAKPGFAVLPFADGEMEESIDIAENFKLIFDLGLALNPGVGILVRPGDVKILTDMIGAGGAAPPSSLRLKLGIQYAKPGGEPTILLGIADGSRMEIQSFAIKGGAAVASNGKHELLAEAELKGGKIVIKAGEGDSFLKTILGENGIEGNFDLLLGWSSRQGVYFQGSGGLEIALPTHISLGPIEILGLTIGIRPEAGKIPIALGADVKGALGPLTAVVQGIGFKAILTFPPNDSGNLGPVNFSPEFKWPTGVGLSIDGGGFTGGGFLFIDVEKGEYAGGLELEFQSIIALKAIGVLSTKMPDGSDGFSLLIIITAEFVPIQLGFGFTLNGVGGLLGLNRTMELEPLRLGVYDGSVNSILFPKDIVANATRIINDIKRIFPPYEGQFVFGPMAKLGWGTPTLISVELGFLLEVPDPVRMALLGVIRLNLPAEEAAIIYIQINFIATLDFEKKQFTLDASLFNSRILTFALTGDMAIRIYWGDDANFLFTIGGFHPSYTPPPMGLPALKRLALIIFSGNPDLRAESYFALTSNTVQFGAKLSLRATGGPAAIHGYLSLDALIQFNPFKFLVEIGAMLAVSLFGEDMLSVRIRMSLEGPSPWHAWGEARISISFFFFDISVTVSFDVSFGEDRREVLPPVEVFEPLLEAFRKVGNWRAELPAGANLMVSLREIPTEEQADKLILHPFGILEVSQKVAPLNMDINKFGTNAPLEIHRYFQVNSLALGAEIFGQDRLDILKEQFAPAQYREMNDAQKLSSQSFAKFDSGIRIKGSDKLKSSYVAALEVVYEVIYVPEKQERKFWKFITELFAVFLKTNATAKSALAFEPKRPSPLDAPKTKVNVEEFVIANTDTLEAHADDLVFATQAEADAARATLTAKDPALAAKLEVMPKYLMN
ncbi:MAG: hypothetical protein EPO28_17490 [Saprospiraceae bacterium]|nr:MAG: hypothetical protein EPO28_17490 [Saprospiraceae bacterium]